MNMKNMHACTACVYIYVYIYVLSTGAHTSAAQVSHTGMLCWGQTVTHVNLLRKSDCSGAGCMRQIDAAANGLSLH
jgi:hypothetical protein